MLAPGELEPVPALLQPFMPGARELIARRCELRKYGAGERIFTRGDEADGLYLVREGGIAVSLEASGRSWDIATIGVGGAMGEMSLLGSERRRTADAHASADGARLLFVPLQLIRELREGMPAEFATALLQLAGLVVDRLEQTNRKLVDRLASERAEGMQRDLVIHDLRGPLASIESGVQSLMIRPEVYGTVSPKQRTALLRIGKNTAFLRLLIDSLLEVERARLQPAQARRSSLGEVLHACAAPLLALVAPERWLAESDEAGLEPLRESRLRLPPPEALQLPVRADPLRLAQVLLNLIGNAIRYTEGAVELDARRAGEQVVVEISDHGPGIPPEHRAQIFDAFKRRELEDRRLPTGKGFGLAGVREMVVSMGGSIAVVDRSDGARGACFRVELPGDAA